MEKKRFAMYVAGAMLMSAVLFTGCKKDTPAPEPEPEPTPAPAPPPPTNTQKLTNKNWKLTALTVSPALVENGVQITDYYAAKMQACEKDNLLSFTSDGKFKEDEGVSKCNSADPQVYTGTWAFNSTETIITMRYDGTTTADDITIIKNDGSTFQFNFVMPINGINYTLSYTYTKQ